MSSNISILALAMAIKEQSTKVPKDGTSLVKMAETNIKAIKESELNIDSVRDDVMIKLIEVLTK